MEFFKEFKKLKMAEIRYLMFFGFVWTNVYFDTLWRRLFHISSVLITNSISVIVMFALAIGCYGQWKDRLRITDWMLYGSLILFYCICFIIYPGMSEILSKNALSLICMTFPYVLIGVMFKYKEYPYWLKIFSYAAVLLNMVYLVLRTNAGEEAYEEQMRKSYALLPSVLYLFYHFMEKRDVIAACFFSIGLFILCALGSRGPFVCFILFAAAYLFFFKKYRHPWMIRSSIIAIASFLILMSQLFAELMIILLSSFGMKSRIFELMLEDAFIDYQNSSGRNVLHEMLIRKLLADERGVGYGPFSDRREIGGYAHNIVIEIWFDYGYYIGSLILLIMLGYIAFVIIKTKDIETKVFVLLLLCSSFVKLIFSGTYLADSILFMLIGVCMYGMRQKQDMLSINNKRKIIEK